MLSCFIRSWWNCDIHNSTLMTNDISHLQFWCSEIGHTWLWNTPVEQTNSQAIHEPFNLSKQGQLSGDHTSFFRHVSILAPWKWLPFDVTRIVIQHESQSDGGSAIAADIVWRRRRVTGLRSAVRPTTPGLARSPAAVVSARRRSGHGPPGVITGQSAAAGRRGQGARASLCWWCGGAGRLHGQCEEVWWLCERD